jgi:hypothetical protein
MKNFKSFEEFIKENYITVDKIKESELTQQQEVNIENFPNPVTSALAKIFINKGYMDGDKVDDVVKTKPVGVPAMKLKASQDAVYLGKALGMAIGGVEGGELGAIISKDDYILDGHHRWAATIFNNPNAVIKGFKADLAIGDLVPVLRALGDVFGNDRRGEPKGGDINIFKASIKDALACIESGANMDQKYYNKDKALAWLESIGGETGLQKALAFIQSTPPPIDAPSRDQMPVIDAEKGEEKKAAQLLNQGKIDVKTPYAHESLDLNEGKSTQENFKEYEELCKIYPHFKTILEDKLLTVPRYAISSIRDQNDSVTFFMNQSFGVSKSGYDLLKKHDVFIQVPGNQDFTFSVSIKK